MGHGKHKTCFNQYGGKTVCHITFHSVSSSVAGAAFYLFCQRLYFLPTCRNRRAETHFAYKSQLCAAVLCCGASCLQLLFPQKGRVVSAQPPPEPHCTTPSQLTSKVLHFLACFRPLGQITAAVKRHGHTAAHHIQSHQREAQIAPQDAHAHTVPDTGNCLALCCCAFSLGVIYSNTTGALRNGSIFQSGTERLIIPTFCLCFLWLLVKISNNFAGLISQQRQAALS